MSFEQQMSALERANMIRYAQAELKRELAAGQLTALDALDDPRLGGITIRQLVLAQPRCGVVAAQGLQRRLKAAGSWCSLDSRVRDLTGRDRAALRTALEGRRVFA